MHDYVAEVASMSIINISQQFVDISLNRASLKVARVHVEEKLSIIMCSWINRRLIRNLE